MTLECKLIKLCLYLVLGKVVPRPRPRSPLPPAPLGLVYVALLYAILVTRDTERDFM